MLHVGCLWQLNALEGKWKYTEILNIFLRPGFGVARSFLATWMEPAAFHGTNPSAKELRIQFGCCKATSQINLSAASLLSCKELLQGLTLREGEN